MSIWSTDQSLNTPDEHYQRPHFGTLSGDHVIGGSVSGKKVIAIVDDSDPRINYVSVTFDPNVPGVLGGSYTANATTDFQFGGTYTVIGQGPGNTNYPGTGAQLRFNGSSIAVLGGVNPGSGTMRVYIDGVETPGRTPIYTGIRLQASGGNQGIVQPTDTYIPTLSGATSFAPTGTIYINAELITYTSQDSTGFFGCTRGAFGTTPAVHNANETVYQWASSIGLYSANQFASKQILYYNPLLAPGDHIIIIVCETNPGSGNAWVYFDGFALGTLLGASTIFTQIATIYIPSVTTSANGHSDLGAPTSLNNDIARLAFLGVTQNNTETDNAVLLSNVGMRYVGNQPFYYIHNGPPSATFSLTLTFAFLGETL